MVIGVDGVAYGDWLHNCCKGVVDVVQATLFYMNPDAPIPVHSAYSALPYQVRNIIVVFIIFRVFLGDHMHSSIRF